MRSVHGQSCPKVGGKGRFGNKHRHFRAPRNHVELYNNKDAQDAKHDLPIRILDHWCQNFVVLHIASSKDQTKRILNCPSPHTERRKNSL